MRKMKDSGIDWIGEIPSDWNVLKLKQLCSMPITDGTHKTPEYADESDGVPFLSSKDVTSGKIDWTNIKYITKDLHKILHKEIAVKRNDVLLAKNGTTGIAALVDCDKVFDIYVTLAVLRPNQKIVLPNYLIYIVNSAVSKIQFDEHLIGIGVPNLHLNVINNVKALVPPLAEQQKIADFLDEKCGEIDSIRSDVQREIEILNDYKKSVITEAVTKGLNPKAKLKDSGIEWIGKIPEGWCVKKLKFYFNFGKGLPITKENLQDTGVPVISYGQIHSKQNSGTAINDTLIRFVNESYLRTNPSSLVHQNDFIFADTSEDLDGCGNCVYVDTKEPLFAGYHAIIFRSLQPNAKYFAYLFLTDCWRSQIRKVVSGVKLYSITQKILKETSVIIPPLSEQKTIADYLDEKCSAIDATITDKQCQLETLDEYKKSLIFEYVTGKKEVPA